MGILSQEKDTAIEPEISPPSGFNRLGLYLHVPFCSSTCDFCAFYQVTPSRDSMERYLAGVEAELASNPPDRPVETVFWGGGTPGILSPKAIERLGSALLTHSRTQPVEWTVELAPATVTEKKLQAMKALGVNRISMGIQSLNPRLLEALGRQHNLTQIQRAWELIQRVGFETCNLDLIFAVPSQTAEELKADIAGVLAMAPDSLSLYCLTFEEDTALYLRLSEGKVQQDPERDAALYQCAWDQLEAAGMEHYEISNFCRPGKACLHNCRTWTMHDWLGYGPAASSQYQGQRWTNVPDLAAWSKGIQTEEPKRVEQVRLSAEDLAIDALIFGLRMGNGVNFADWLHRFGTHLEPQVSPVLQKLEHEDLLETDRERFKLTRQGKLLCDGVGAQLLEMLG